MEQFIVSARKYRPQTFKDVVGQQAITNTLLNAIENNHLAQALLFTGPRGVGKTTCARILARKINQEGYDDPYEDFAFNVFELDAASNNSVDDIRSLIDQVRIPPQTGKYKVYIIDEVHMLSQAAFNAFLKTLEEPPRHAIFILEECIAIRNRQGGCKTGEAVITSGGNLAAKFVIHTVGPVWQGGQKNEERLLSNAYKNSLRLAVENKVETVAFPNISTGVYGFPKDIAAKIAVDTVRDFVNGDSQILKVIFCCYDEENYNIYNSLPQSSA